MSVFGWLNDQLLRMTWLNDLVGAGVAAIGLIFNAISNWFV